MEKLKMNILHMETYLELIPIWRPQKYVETNIS